MDPITYNVKSLNLPKPPYLFIHEVSYHETSQPELDVIYERSLNFKKTEYCC